MERIVIQLKRELEYEIRRPYLNNEKPTDFRRGQKDMLQRIIELLVEAY